MGNKQIDEDEYSKPFDEDEYSTPKSNIFIDALNKIENFDFSLFKKKQDKKKQDKKDKKEVEQILKDSETTIEDIGKERESFVRKLIIRIVIIAIVIILLSSAVILSLQDNEQIERKKIDTKAVINKSTSFGNLGQKNFFMEQNVLNEKIDIVESKINMSITKMNKDLNNQITDTFATFLETNKQTTRKMQSAILDEVKKGNKDLVVRISENSQAIQVLSEKQKQLEKQQRNVQTVPRLNGKLIMPSFNSNNTNSSSTKRVNTNGTAIASKQPIKYKIIDEEIEVEEEIAITDEDIALPGLKSVNTYDKKEKTFKEFQVDIPLSFAKVTLLSGFSAPTGDIGKDNPVPVLMQIEDDFITSRDHRLNLNGCFLKGSAFGNINSGRAEIFGTHLSCVIETENGKLFKIEENLADNSVWIQGEDGENGVDGIIVDSSGKVLSKTVAMGFLQGVSQYLTAKAEASQANISADGTTTSALSASMQSGLAQGLGSSFDLVIAQYEKILKGYYPYVNVKGGRKNMTAIFPGMLSITIKEFKDTNIDDMIESNMAQGYDYKEGVKK